MFKYFVLLTIIICIGWIGEVIIECFRIKYYDNYTRKKLKI